MKKLLTLIIVFGMLGGASVASADFYGCVGDNGWTGRCVCKDPEADNYNGFGVHKQSICRYTGLNDIEYPLRNVRIEKLDTVQELKQFIESLTELYEIVRSRKDLME